MSGFEVVGVVLAVVPLVVSGLQEYAKGVNTIRRMLTYKWELEMLITTLETEEVLFRNTCEQLLDGVAGVGVGEMEELLKNPGGPSWKQGDLGRGVEDRLSKSYSIFFKRVKDMEEALEEFKRRLGLDSEGKIRWTDKGALKKALKGGQLVLTMENFKDLFARIKEDNRTLKELTNQSIQLQLSRRGRSQARKLNYLRSYALDIYRAIGTAFRCKCKHQAGLSLSYGTRESPQLLVHKDERPYKILISGVSGQNPHDWQQLQLEIVAITQSAPSIHSDLPDTQQGLEMPKRRRVGFADELFSKASEGSLNITQHLVLRSLSLAPVVDYSSLSPHPLIAPTTKENTEEIQDFCQKLRLQSTSSLSGPLGMISDKSKKFIIHPLKFQSDGSTAPATISLAQILNRKGSSMPGISFTERLRIAVTVSSAVLELHHTPWMQSEPSKNGFFFFSGTRRIHTSAFVATTITQTVAETYPNNDDLLPPYIENKALFCLGILLIELLWGKSIEDICVEKYPTLSDGKLDLEKKYLIATKLLQDGEVDDEGGFKYESAVRSCIKCNFEKFRNMDLNDDDFRQTVHEKVVTLLEDTSKALG